MVGAGPPCLPLYESGSGLAYVCPRWGSNAGMGAQSSPVHVTQALDLSSLPSPVPPIPCEFCAPSSSQAAPPPQAAQVAAHL